MGMNPSKRNDSPVYLDHEGSLEPNVVSSVTPISLTSKPPRPVNRTAQKSFRKALTGYIKKRRKSDISATFSILETSFDDVKLINVNVASEEELMTLAGVTRSVAQNIVKYRRMINGFKQIEDLALVPGIGADKLFKFSNEICVSNNKASSYGSSHTPSFDSLQSSCSTQQSSPLKTYNINTATIFDLMNIRGLDQKLAASIVCHRQLNGPFKTVNDLIKVKGFCPKKLGSIKFFLTVEDCNGNQNYFSPAINNTLAHRRTISAPVKLSELCSTTNLTSLNYEDNTDVFEILSSRTKRPILEEIFMDMRNGQTAFRLGSWDLREACESKTSNPGVREVVCRTILENGLSILAVQEASHSGLRQICQELNKPFLPQVRQWEGILGDWKYCTADTGSPDDYHTCGFMYDSSRNINLNEVLVFPDLVNLYYVPIFGAYFTIDNLKIVFISFKLPAMKSEDIKLFLEKLTASMDIRFRGINIVFCCSTSFPCNQRELSHLKLSEYFPVFSPTTTTHYISKPGIKYYDNFWINNCLCKNLTKHHGVIRQGLSHLAIPNGWSWGGHASDHSPIWCEFYMEVPNKNMNGCVVSSTPEKHMFY